MLLAVALGRTKGAREIREAFGVSAKTLRRWHAAGWIQRIGSGRGVRYSVDEVRQVLYRGEDWAGRSIDARGEQLRALATEAREVEADIEDYEKRWDFG